MKLGRPRFTRSIRFRLTSWYSLLLLLVLLVLGISLLVLIGRDLRADVDRRLMVTARTMVDQFRVRMTPDGPLVVVPPPDSFTFPSLLIEVVDNRGRVWFASENLGDRNLPSPDPSLQSSEPQFQTTTINGIPLRVLNYPVRIRNQTVGSVNVGAPLLQVNQTLERLRRTMLVLAVTGAVVTAMVAWSVAGRALRPLREITSATELVAATPAADLALSTRLTVPPTQDEIARLASTFNDMLVRLDEAFTAQRRFVADASHELRTPLTALRGNVDLLARQMATGTTDPEDVEETLAELRRESERMNRLATDLLALARAEAAGGVPLQCSWVNVREVLEETARTVAAAGATCAIRIEGPGEVTVETDRDRLSQIVLILTDNAVRHTPDDGYVTLAAKSIAGHGMEVTVSDTGEGIAPGDLAHIFDRFYRVAESRDRAGGGTGLGLPIARATARALGGELTAQSQFGEGSTFRFHLARDNRCAGVAD